MRFLILILMAFGSVNIAYAGCHVTDKVTNTVNFGNITVPRDAAIGTVLGTVNIQGTGTTYASCDDFGTGWQAEEMVNGQPAGIDNVYKTNVDGVGIQGIPWSQEYGFFTNPATRQWNTNTLSYWDNASKVNSFKLIKTGPITGGTINLGMFARVYFDDGQNAMEYNFIPVTIKSLTCSVTTPTLTFPIGDVPQSSFGSTVGFSPNSTSLQNLGLNCDAGANINVMLTGTQNPDVSNTSVLALTGQGAAGTAKGVGVQLLYNGTPLTLNNTLSLRQSTSGQNTFPITARYYQTKTVVNAGNANSTATLTLTYQ